MPLISRRLTSYSKVQRLIGSIIRNKKSQSRFRSISGKTYLDIGCGWKTHAHMINLDWQWHPQVDICWDIAKLALPIENARLDGIYSEHCLEHHSPTICLFILSECLRVLRPGGRLRIVLPDAEKYLSTYNAMINGNDDAAYPYPEDLCWGDIWSPLLGVNRIFYQDRQSPYGHCFMYDKRLLQAFLEKSGFCKIKLCAFRSGGDHSLLLDSPERWEESFAMEAQRPEK